MSPTVCQSCGGRIGEPSPDRHVCDGCMSDMQDTETNLIRKGYDPSDLTQKLWRLQDRRNREEWVHTGIAAFALACVAIMIMWLGKQAGLWG